MNNSEKITLNNKVLLILNIIVLSLTGISGVCAAGYLYNAKDVSYSNTTSGISSSNVQSAIDNLYASAVDYNSLDDRITTLVGKVPPTRLYLTRNTGTLVSDRSFTVGDAVFVSLKYKGVDITANTSVLLATIPSYSTDYETACVGVVKSGNNRRPATCWIRSNGQLVFGITYNFTGAEVSIITNFIK